MENASKAVLIAGAVLVVIAIISIAAYVYSKSADTSKLFNNRIDAASMQLHNSNFSGFEAQSAPYSRAKDTILAVLTNNTKNTTPEELRISITVGTKTVSGTRTYCSTHSNQITAVQLKRLLDSVDPTVAGAATGGCELLNSRNFKYDIEPVYAGSGLLTQIRILKLI